MKMDRLEGDVGIITWKKDVGMIVRDDGRVKHLFPGQPDEILYTRIT